MSTKEIERQQLRERITDLRRFFINPIDDTLSEVPEAARGQQPIGGELLLLDDVLAILNSQQEQKQ